MIILPLLCPSAPIGALARLRTVVLSGLVVVSVAASLQASVPVTGRFNLASDGLHVFGPKPLAESRTVMQSFAFDNTNNYVYVAQVTQAGVGGKTYAQHLADGDLTVSKLTTSGTYVSAMHLTRFGHGVAIGVEPVGTSAYLWVEVDSKQNGNGEGRGTKIGRVQYVAGATRDQTYSGISKYTPAAGGAHATDPEYSCNIDMAYGRVAVRYLASNGTTRKLGLYSLSSVKSGGTTALCTVTVPAGLGANENDPSPPPYTFQGFTSHGSYVYLLYGDSYNVVPSPGNTELYSFDWNVPNPSTWVQEATTAVFGSTIYREPEGMGIQKVGSTYRLCFGFATHVSSSNDNRVANIAYKDGWIP